MKNKIFIIQVEQVHGGATSTMLANVFFTLLCSSILFTVSGESAWDYYVHMLDTTFSEESITFIAPDVDTISFYLYTRENPVNGTVITLNDAKSVQASYWSMTKLTVIIIHGWNSDGSAKINTDIRDAFLQVADVNVIVVDWGTISRNLVYSTVAQDVPYVAAHVGNFMNFLRTNAGLSFSNLEIVGHSLGAHVAGLAAKSVMQNGMVARIVGLDPAKPWFEDKGPNSRLDRSQAKYVQVVHTCAGLLGIAESIGNSDFYANDGRDQPGCGDDITGGCAHERSFIYFAESVKNPKAFPSLRDSDGGLAYMGGATLDLKAHGSYHFKTTSSPPYTVNF